MNNDLEHNLEHNIVFVCETTFNLLFVFIDTLDRHGNYTKYMTIVLYFDNFST